MALALGLAGCEPALVPLTPEKRSLSVFIADPPISYTGESARNCAPGSMVKTSMSDALIAAGYRVVTSPDADIRIDLSSPKCWWNNGGVYQTIAGTARAKDTVLVSRQTDGQYWNIEFANQLTSAIDSSDLRHQGSPAVAAAPEAKPKAKPKAKAPAPAEEAAPAKTPATPAAPPGPAYGVKMKRGAPQPNAYALVVGVEKYRDVPAPVGARTDAERFAKLAHFSLGVPQDHILLDVDDHASKSDLDKHLAWLAANVPAGGRAYFFFAGHGSPDPNGAAYLLPYDGDPKSLAASAYRVDDVLSALRKTKANEVIAFVDACYSGAGGRSVLAPGARALAKVVEPKVTAAGSGPREALFASAAASEISGPMPGQPVGLFTQMVLRGAGAGEADIDGDGNVSLEELGEWIPPRVAREAKKDSRDQNPSLQLASGFGDAKTVWLSSGLSE